MIGAGPAGRRVIAAAVDAVIWVGAVVLAASLHHERGISHENVWPVLILALSAAALQVLLGYVTSLYRGRHPYGSFDEVRDLALVVTTVVLGLSIPLMIGGRAFGLPRTTMLFAFPIALVLMFGIRYITRLVLEHRAAPDVEAEPTLVYGAGALGDMLIKNTKVDPSTTINPVGLIDDDASKSQLRVRGVPVLGDGTQLAKVAADTGATRLVVAIAAADSAFLRKISDRAERAGLSVSVLPPLGRILSGERAATDFRELSIEDLIGRAAVDTNVAQIAGYISGKRVLVTGAGGSIGSELARQLQKYGPSELIMLDRDETGLQTAQLGIFGHGLLDSKDVVLADIRDPEALNAIFQERRPEVVFHAAALKHLPMLEQYPEEAWKTNVLGTLNVLNAARAVGVETFVNISTDKAANPTSALGHSKRVAEKLTSWMADGENHRYLSVRFGNVIGSRGSMLPTFQALINAGGPLTVTHPEVTRYFMTIPEACQLVIQAGGVGRPREVLILDMGEPVSIREVAERMIAMSGKNIEIRYTGLRPGEKLHEVLVGDTENLERPYHSKISHTTAKPISPEQLDYEGWLARLGDSHKAVTADK